MKKVYNAFHRAPLLALAVLLATSCSQTPKYPGPLSAQESMKTFHFADDFKAEVYATEPFVTDPVSMVFDPHGNAYVVEMADANMPDSIKGKGCIVLLKDTDGDGRVDTKTIFASGLKEATSVLPWKDGLIVTAAPNILYLKDTNGDGKADSTEILFSGFFENNDEAQITSLRFCVDNWIYANNDGEAGEVSSNLGSDTEKLSMQGADFRFRLDHKKFERTTGPGQFGQAIDDWGHRFFTKNSLHIQQAVIPRRYLERNPYMPSFSAVKNISDHDPIMYQLTDAPYWREERTRRRNAEYQKHHLDRVEYAKDHFTGSSGGTFYGGNMFPAGYYGSIFTGDVSGNLVHRDKLTLPDDKNDPFYTARRGNGEKDKEFMAATDKWVRPTSFAVGPDGYLYMVDMYRQHIETPVSIPDDLAAEMDFSAGSDLGRIYRIEPKDAGSYHKPAGDLYDMPSADLVKMLEDPNRWKSLNAHQLLVERQDHSVIPAVMNLFEHSGDARARLHALYVLEGLDALNASVVKQALTDSASGVRENAVILAERFPECLPDLARMTGDSSTRVTFQLALSLGDFKGNVAVSALAGILSRFGDNSWFRTAILSSDATASTALLMAEAKQDPSFFQKPAPWKISFVRDLAYCEGARNDRVRMRPLLDFLSKAPASLNKQWQSSAVKGIVDGLGMATDQTPGLKALVAKLKQNKDGGQALADLTGYYSKLSHK